MLTMGWAYGQTLPSAGDGTTVVTVTAQAMPLASTSASVTILTRDYIESSHADNAADLLRSAPFLQVAQSGASGGLTTVTIRGGKPNFTLVLIDGIPVNDPTNTSLAAPSISPVWRWTISNKSRSFEGRFRPSTARTQSAA